MLTLRTFWGSDDFCVSRGFFWIIQKVIGILKRTFVLRNRIKLNLLSENITIQFQKQLPEVFHKKGVLKNFAKFTGKHLCQSLFFKKNFIKKETLAQVFSCEFCEIFKNTFFTEHLWIIPLLHMLRP